MISVWTQFSMYSNSVTYILFIFVQIERLTHFVSNLYLYMKILSIRVMHIMKQLHYIFIM